MKENKQRMLENMKTLTLKEIEERVAQNSKQLSHTINSVTRKVKSQNLKQGRVRPKDPTEAKILEKFDRK